MRIVARSAYLLGCKAAEHLAECQNMRRAISPYLIACALPIAAMPGNSYAIPVPHIYYKGKEITDKDPGEAIAGERISLTTTPGARPGQDQFWTVTLLSGSGILIGGFDDQVEKCATCPNVSPTQCGGPIVADIDSPYEDKWYFTGAGVYEIQYTYVLKNGDLQTTTAQMDISGPSAKVNNPIETNFAILQNGSHYAMSYGSDKKSSPGIKFTYTVSDAPDGQFEWAQVIGVDEIEYDQGGNFYGCDVLFGLDGQFPYAVNGNTGDSPAVPITGHDDEDRSFTAQMYLLWKSSLPDTIPVPIGSALWGFDELDTYNTQTQSWPTPMGAIIPPTVSQNTTGYPTWSSVTDGHHPKCKVQ